MVSYSRGVEMFTAENICAVLRAIPEADETYKQIALRAGELGITIGLHTISRWVNAGRADIKECRNDTAYRRFAKHYCRLIGERCSADADRHRELNRALATVERTCECGDEKM